MKDLLDHGPAAAVTRVLAAGVGIILLTLGVGMLVLPEVLATSLFSLTARPAGINSLRADFAALFLGMGIFCLLGSFSRHRWLLVVPGFFLLLVICGRLIGALVDGFPMATTGALVAELLFLLILLLAIVSYVRSTKAQASPPVLKIVFSRAFVIPLGILVLVVAVALHMRASIGTWLFDRYAGDIMARSDIADLPDGLHVVLAGTGSPMPDPRRAGASTVVIAGKYQFIVDSGPGSTLNLERMKIPLEETDAVLLTHMHSDHIAGLGELLLKAWTGGARTGPLRVLGPVGVETVVEGFDQAFTLDTGYRHAHHGDAVAPTSGAGGRSEAILGFGQDGSTVVFKADDLTVTAFLVDHRPVVPALGYRFDYRGRSVVISGDTLPTESVRHHAAGVDLLVHEAMEPQMLSSIARAAAETGQKVVEHVAADILTYHTFPEEAARIAHDAGVGHLVLHHVIPPVPFSILEPAFLGESQRLYPGPITLGADGMLFSLLPNTTEIQEAWLLR